MAVITRAYSEVTGQIAYASSINKIIDDLYTLQDGNIGLGNIENSGVGETAISDSAVTTGKIALSAVTTVQIASTANISYDKFNDSTLPSASLWTMQRLFLEGF